MSVKLPTRTERDKHQIARTSFEQSDSVRRYQMKLANLLQQTKPLSDDVLNISSKQRSDMSMGKYKDEDNYGVATLLAKANMKIAELQNELKEKNDVLMNTSLMTQEINGLRKTNTELMQENIRLNKEHCLLREENRQLKYQNNQLVTQIHQLQASITLYSQTALNSSHDVQIDHLKNNLPETKNKKTIFAYENNSFLVCADFKGSQDIEEVINFKVPFSAIQNQEEMVVVFKKYDLDTYGNQRKEPELLSIKLVFSDLKKFADDTYKSSNFYGSTFDGKQCKTSFEFSIGKDKELNEELVPFPLSTVYSGGIYNCHGVDLQIDPGAQDTNYVLYADQKSNYVRVTFCDPTQHFTRDGNNLKTSVDVSYTEDNFFINLPDGNQMSLGISIEKPLFIEYLGIGLPVLGQPDKRGNLVVKLNYL
ncbi:hypothetical protein EIN_430540 [Entamoeba invadens IP1]|uniref:Uncharacterized protein n=1 Tax=Entamoeba invadens IP1 TaxID=370355 RepID=A0A0A1UFG6_ENTIV|nr:hypothetical protein EIN_430540 [Entamoeba invadens IP1]ELP95248.1 hypothetical protein EIN_430540 [Entamoeba invadens IP1]|eukprot:XP_004262019.1 hypothetical protein EIN_430540 [Entamoeba invadens IP1]